MAFRTDAQIRGWTEESMGALGRPRCLPLAALLPYMNLEPTSLVYQQVFFPFDTPAYAAQVAPKMSACGLFAEVGWRFAGVNAPLLYVPYESRVAHGGIQFAVAYEKAFAQQVKASSGQPAWVDAIDWIEGTPLPEPSSAVIIGCASCPGFARGTANLEHEFTVGAWDPDVAAVSHNLDGGQPGTRFRSRGWVQVFTHDGPDGRARGELWCGTVTDDGRIPVAADGRPVTGRRCLGWADTRYLPMTPPADHRCLRADGSEAGGGLLGVDLGISDDTLLVAAAAAAALLAFTPPGRAALQAVAGAARRLVA